MTMKRSSADHQEKARVLAAGPPSRFGVVDRYKTRGLADVLLAIWEDTPSISFDAMSALTGSRHAYLSATIKKLERAGRLVVERPSPGARVTSKYTVVPQ